MSNLERSNPDYGLNKRQLGAVLGAMSIVIFAADYLRVTTKGGSFVSKDLSTSDLNTWSVNGQSILSLYPDLAPVNYLAQGGKPRHRDFLLTGIERELVEKTTSLPDLKIVPQYSDGARSSRPNLVGYKVIVEQHRIPLNKIDDTHTLSGFATALDLASIAQEYTTAAMPWLGNLNQREVLTSVIAKKDFCEFAKFAGRMRVGTLLRAILEEQTKEGVLLTQNPLVTLEYKRYQRFAQEKGLLFKDQEGIWRWPGDTMPRVSWQDYKDFLEWSNSRLTPI